MKLIKRYVTKIGVSSVEELISQTIPDAIRLENELDISAPLSEYEMLQHSKELAAKNLDYDTYIGFGYHNSILPSVIQRNILENVVGTPLIHLIKQKLHKVD